GRGDAGAFRGEPPDHRLDADVAAGELVQAGDEAEAFQRGVAGTRVELALLDLAAEEVRDPSARPLSALGVDLVPDRLEARLDGELRDSRAHRAQADHADSATPDHPPSLP